MSLFRFFYDFCVAWKSGVSLSFMALVDAVNQFSKHRCTESLSRLKDGKITYSHERNFMLTLICPIDTKNKRQLLGGI